jgi:hypothetical protein
MNAEDAAHPPPVKPGFQALYIHLMIVHGAEAQQPTMLHLFKPGLQEHHQQI